MYKLVHVQIVDNIIAWFNDVSYKTGREYRRE